MKRIRRGRSKKKWDQKEGEGGERMRGNGGKECEKSIFLMPWVW
jgi:hypothetical protein